MVGVPAAYYLPLMVAQDQHLFEKYGLRSELTLKNNNNDMMNMLLHGDADVSALGSGGAFPLEAASPERVRFIYGQYAHSYSLIVPTESTIKSLQDLKGKKIGTWPSPTSRVFLHLILDSRIGADSFQVVPLEFRFLNQALNRGDVDALFNTDVFTEEAIQSGSARYLSRYPMEEYVQKPFFNGGGLVQRSFQEKNPKVYEIVLKVMDEAITFIQTNESAARQSLIAHVGVSSAVANNAPLDQFVRFSEIDLGSAQHVADLLFAQKVLPRKIEVKVMFE